jgi:hypothetical protein
MFLRLKERSVRSEQPYLRRMLLDELPVRPPKAFLAKTGWYPGIQLQ